MAFPSSRVPDDILEVSSLPLVVRGLTLDPEDSISTFVDKSDQGFILPLANWAFEVFGGYVGKDVFSMATGILKTLLGYMMNDLVAYSLVKYPYKVLANNNCVSRDQLT